MTYTSHFTTLGATFTGRGISPIEAQLNAISAADRYEQSVQMPVWVADWVAGFQAEADKENENE